MFAACCASVPLLPVASLFAQAAPQDQEIGTLHWGPAVVWLRATGTGQVELFASTGFRSAFVQPVMLSAEDAERWSALLDQLGCMPLSDAVAGSAAPPSHTDTSHVVLSDGEIVLEMQPQGTSEAKLRVWVGATRPDAVVAVVIPEGAAESALMLRNATRVARGMHRRSPWRPSRRQRHSASSTAAANAIGQPTISRAD